MLEINIVNDSIKYEDENNKSKGYNVVNGNKDLDVGSLEILKGGRGKLWLKIIFQIYIIIWQ